MDKLDLTPERVARNIANLSAKVSAYIVGAKSVQVRVTDLRTLLASNAALEAELKGAEEQIEDLENEVSGYEADAKTREVEITALEAKLREAEDAMTPSADTKAAYSGEFRMGITLRLKADEEYRAVLIPWTTIKEIMAAIKARAFLTPDQSHG
jgi:predicted nuclease with TOPRIM domain